MNHPAELLNPELPTIKQIIATVAHHTGIGPADIIETNRHREVCRPRQLAMWLARRLRPDLTPAQLGREFKRDRTTILHACEVTEARAAHGQTAEKVWRRLTDAAMGVEAGGWSANQSRPRLPQR